MIHMTSSEFMPEDLLIAILECLHVKSLLRFKCVSKSWCNLIRNPIFVNAHLQKQLKNDRVLLVSRSSRDSSIRRRRVFSFHDLDSPELEQLGPNIHIPEDNQMAYDDDLVLLGPCNGIVCLANDNSVVLCNPSLREFKHLPCCPFAGKSSIFWNNSVYKEVSMRWGFGNTCTNGFILIQLQYTYTHTYTFSVAKGESLVEAYLYDSGTSLWRKIKDTYKVSTHMTIPNSDTFLNGACHWLVLNSKILPTAIITLDVSNEVFTVFDYPDWAVKPRLGSWNLKVMNKCLAMVWQGFDYGVQRIKVWVMKEYGVTESWTKVVSVSHQGLSTPLFLKNDMWMLIAEQQGLVNQMAYHDLSSNEIEIKRYGISGYDSSFWARIYNESLITLN